jgi:uncharacterized protein (DUF2336 family)
MSETPECRSILDELEASLASNSVHHRLNVLQRVTDLFVAGSTRYSGAEIALFDDVLTRLAEEIEVQARARLAGLLAPLPDSPRGLIRKLAFDDAIEVASPVLVASPQLSDADLVENASTKSQDHLYAIAQRFKLSEAVTDVLVERGNRRVVRRAARNNGAEFSLKSYQRMVRYARDDRRLALSIGRRHDVPRQCFLKLLETASFEMRKKLEALNPQAAREIRETVAEVAETMQREAREGSRRHHLAARRARHLFRMHRLSEQDVHAAAHSQHFVKTAAALAMLGPFPIDLVERVLIDKGTETVLILAKAAGCTWTTAKAMLMMHSAGRGLSQQDLEQAAAAFDRLNRETAQRVVKFYERRGKTGAAEEASAVREPTAEAELQAIDEEVALEGPGDEGAPEAEPAEPTAMRCA